MKLFYTAKNFKGEVMTGEADVKNERDLAAQLRGDGYVLTSSKVMEAEKSTKSQSKLLDKFFSGISLKEKLLFTRNLGVMVASGIPLSRAIKNISAQTRNQKFQKMLDDIYNDVQSGTAFSDGLAKYPAVFNDLFVNMVRVGETSGNLEEVLSILEEQIQKEHELISRVKGAMTYPAVIICVMIATGIFMLTYILPKITKVFKDMKTELPGSTQFIINSSDFFRAHAVLVGVGFVIFFILWRIFSTTDSGKRFTSFMLLQLPITKNMVIKINCARFCRIYSSLLKSGVSVLESLRIVSNTLTNYYYKVALTECIEEIQKGINLSKIVERHPNIFPVLVIQMLEVGEETGRTETVLLKLAEFYEDEVNQITKNMSSIIEPVLMVLIGACVGFFAIAMMQPMYSVMQGIK